MRIYPLILFAPALVSAAVAVPKAARADVLMNASARTQCLDMSSGSARLGRCNGAASQNFISSYGAQRYNGMCLQGTGGNNATNTLSLKPCNGSKDQQWAISSNGNFKNEGGWCAAATSSGAVIAAQCYGGGTYAWSTGRFLPAASAGLVAIKLISASPGTAALPQLKSAVVSPVVGASGPGAAQLVSSVGSVAQIVAQGGGNIVAQGGGNIVAQGGGNIVAQGGGNVIATTGGAIVAQGGGN